ncbi:MAG: M1 family aminopeptidase [Christensenellales bacterium]
MERMVGNTKIFGSFNSRKDSAAMEQVIAAAAFALECYSRIYMECPYDMLIVTNNGWATKANFSMECSGFITVSFGNTDEGSFNNTINTYHEMAHQWFYFLVGNDKNAEPWLGGSFAEISVGICFEESGNTEWAETYWETRKQKAVFASGEMLNKAYDETEYYVPLMYGKGAVFLKELMDAVGRNEFLSILSDYCKSYAYKNATTQDFLSILREKSIVDVEGIVKNRATGQNGKNTLFYR